MSSGASDEDDRLDMQRLTGGHDAALNSLMERHTERLFRFLVRELQSETEAADLAEESFVRVYENCRRFDTSRRFSTWLYAIAMNLVRDRYRWRTRHPEVSIDAPVSEPGTGWSSRLPDGKLDPGQTLEQSERSEAVRRAVADLPDELRAALILAEYEGLSHQEIGEVLDCSPKAVEMRLYRGRQQLRKQLARLQPSVN